MPTPMQIEDALRRADPPASWGGRNTPPPPPPPPPAIQWSKGGRTPDEEKARTRALVEMLRRRDQRP